VARSVGTLSLVLRNQMDVADINTGGATKHTLLGKAELPAPAPLAAPAPVTRTVVKTRTVAAAPRAGNCVGVLAGIRAAWSASDRGAKQTKHRDT
jgi:pilus assembly protein CpaB